MDGHYRIKAQGGPDVLEWHSEAPRELGPGDVLVRHTAIGLNYIDVYHRSGLYKLPLPSRLGVEAAGRVEATGKEVTRTKVGDRVGYALGMGAYGESNVVNEAFIVVLPEQITDETAAAVLLKGLTVSYLLRKTHAVTAGDTLLVHAAAGGVGLLLCQWANHIGATVIGTVGSEAKAELARSNGAHHTILYNQEDVVARVRELTDGAGVNVSYDSVGAATYERSLNSLAPLGKFVSFGSASGKIPSVNPHDLQVKGSLFFTRPSLANYATPPSALDDLANSLFEVIASGAVEVHIKQRYALSDAAQAHVDLEARATTGSTVIIPGS